MKKSLLQRCNRNSKTIDQDSLNESNSEEYTINADEEEGDDDDTKSDSAEAALGVKEDIDNTEDNVNTEDYNLIKSFSTKF